MNHDDLGNYSHSYVVDGLKARIEELAREIHHLRNHISVLNEGHAQQIKQLTDPIVRAKMLEPAPPILITNTDRIEALERVARMALDALLVAEKELFAMRRDNHWTNQSSFIETEVITELRKVLGEEK